MNINSVNYVNQEDSIRKASINVRNNVESGEEKSVSQTFAAGTVSGLGSTTSTQNAAQSAKALMQEADDVLEQLKQSAQNAQASLDALFKKLSGADCVRLDEDGFGLNDTEPDKIVTVVERIKIMLATYCEDYQPMGLGVDTDKIKEVVGSAGLANAAASKLQGYDVPVTEENLEDVADAFDMLKNTGELSENAKMYLVKNGQEPTVENIYNAQHKSSQQKYADKSPAQQAGRQDSIKENVWEELKPQIEKLIKSAGLEVNDNNMNNARRFMEQDIPVTEENLRYKALLDSLDMFVYRDIPEDVFPEALDGSDKDVLDGSDRQSAAWAYAAADKALEAMASVISEGKSAKEAYVTDKTSDWKTVANVINVINSADEADVCEALKKSGELNVSDLEEAIGGRSGDTDIAEYIRSMTKDELENYRRLEELRILMTAEAGLSLARQGFDLNREPLIKLVEELEKMELAWAEEAAPQVLDVRKAVYEISKAPADFIGVMIFESEKKGAVTLEVSAQAGSSFRQRYREAGQTYEAVGTEVRRDLGDSVSKAVAASTQDLLNALGLEDNKANRDAIRILGNNGIEMTRENAERVKEIYSSLKSLVKNMTPEAALSMIRNGVDPMKSDIDDVNAYLVELNQGKSNDEKFSTFLYKLDRTKGITEEERRQFIGIYRMMNIFTKDAGKAAGALLRQGADMTMSNLMAAYSSRKAAGIDARIDDSTGMAEIRGTVNYYNNLFDASADKITPRTLKTVNDEEKIAGRSVEGFLEAVDDNYDIFEEAQYYDEYLAGLNDIKEADEAVLTELSRFDLGITISDIRAMQEIMQSGWGSQALKTLKPQIRERALDMLESLDDREETEAIRGELAEASEDELEAVVSSTESRDELENMRMRSRMIFMVNDMAKKHDYRIPFEENNEIGTIHLQLVHDDENAGHIAIDVETSGIGKMHIEARAGSGGVSVFAVTDGDDALLGEKLAIAADGIQNMTFNISRSEEVPKADLLLKEDGISTGRLYTIAKTIIRAVVSE